MAATGAVPIEPGRLREQNRPNRGVLRRKESIPVCSEWYGGGAETGLNIIKVEVR